jgi:UDP-glucose 4-epimerase
MIIITGATGFIGTYLVQALVERGSHVLALGRNERGAQYFKAKRIPFMQVDIENPDGFARLPKKNIEAIVHLAAIIPEHRSPDTNGKDMLLTNGLGTWHALDYARRVGCKKFVYTTSRYEASNVKRMPIDEEAIDYINHGDHVEYIIAKIAGAQCVNFFAEEYGIQGIVMRTTCIRGYSQYLNFHAGDNLPRSNWERFIRMAYKGKPIEVWGDCTTHLRDHLYVKDAASCLMAAIDSDTAIGRYQMASGKGITFDEEIKTIVKVFSPAEKKSKLIYKPEKKNAIDSSWIYDISKTTRDLGWKPKYSTEAYLEDIKLDMIKMGAL